MHLPITVLPGDGIGPEVVAEALKVLRAVADLFDHQLDVREYPFGSSGLRQCGTGFPEQTRRACLDRPGILLGAVGDPEFNNLPPNERPEAALLALRRLIGSFANLRPIHCQFIAKTSPFREETLRGVDMLIVRELTGGLYFGEPRGIEGEGAERRGFNTLSYNVTEIERIAKVAFETAMGRRKRVVSVDKSNVLESSKLWREVVTEVGKSYPDVALDHMYVDRAAMEIVMYPKNIDVMLTGNLFGDILSDEASVLTGSLGLLPSASIGGDVGIYEPVHGSAPDIVGKGIANPIGAIASVALMLRYSFELEEEARSLETGVQAAFDAGCITADLAVDGGARSTSEVGDFIAGAVAKG